MQATRTGNKIIYSQPTKPDFFKISIFFLISVKLSSLSSTDSLLAIFKNKGLGICIYSQYKFLHLYSLLSNKKILIVITYCSIQLYLKFCHRVPLRNLICPNFIILDNCCISIKKLNNINIICLL